MAVANVKDHWGKTHPLRVMKAKHVIVSAVWIVCVWLTWVSSPWNSEVGDGNGEPVHPSTFHMHRPLHSGGRVSMSDQFHLELVSEGDGTHRLWISNAFRQELDPAGFEGRLKIEPVGGEAVEVAFERVDRGNELRATSKPLTGQAWLTITGGIGTIEQFRGVKFFWDYDLQTAGLRSPLGLDSMVPVPKDNRPTKDKVELGRELFFDPILSADGTISCASCHRPEFAFADNRAHSRGINGKKGTRNTPSVINVAYHEVFFWDGRSQSLEDQAIDPLFNHAEMGANDKAQLLERLKPKYGERTESVFGEALSLDTIAKAIACYERTLLSGDSDFDRHEAGVPKAINPAAKRGRTLFFEKARCGSCHIPPLFTDYRFHNLGVGWISAERSDLGRFDITKKSNDLGAFKTPSLRDITRTAPYMHDGSHKTLRKVVEFYNRGCEPNENLDPIIRPLGLNDQEMNDLVAFLKTLDGRTIESIDTGASNP